MRPVVIFALLLLALPALVLVTQVRRSQEGIGAPSDYLEIETPPEIALGDPALERSGIPVLCYHYLSPRPGPMHVLRVIGAVVLNLPTIGEKHFWSLPVGVFESHLRWLREEGYTTLSADELVEVMAGQRSAPEKSVCITFDDGERSLLDLGLPLLRKYDMKATLFVVTAQVGQQWKDLAMMNWAELRELQSSGHVTIHSHTHDMHYKVKTADGGMQPVHQFRVRPSAAAEERAQVVADLARSRVELERHLGRQTHLLAWPYGFGNDALDEIARGAGFEATFSLLAGATRPDADDTWHVRRFTITARTTGPRLEEMVAD